MAVKKWAAVQMIRGHDALVFDFQMHGSTLIHHPMQEKMLDMDVNN